MKEKDPNEFCKNICKGYKQTGKCIFDNRCEAYKTYEKDFIGIDIPFGAKDSEMKGWTYTIPEGFEAEIKDGKVIVREKESEDERIRKEIVGFLDAIKKDRLEARRTITDRYGDAITDDMIPTWLAWLEKQGEPKPAGKMQVSEELYEHIRNTCACIDDALSSETIADVTDYLEMASQAAQSAFDMIEKQGEQNQKHFELKAGHWYICHRAFCCRADSLTVKEGERFMCEKDGVVKGFVIKEPEKYFKECSAPAPMEEEQEPADKVEPKFKVGDWLQYRNSKPFLVEEITEQGYVNGDSCLPFDWENEIHLWTIQDAKKGDILSYDKSKCIAMFLKIENVSFKDICFIGAIDHKFYSGGWHDIEDAHPATEEQCDLLFKKMKEAGYEWDAEKKELKKLAPKCDTCTNDKGCVTCVDGDQWEGKPTWSEEDERRLKEQIDAVEYDLKNTNISYQKECCEAQLTWLKSLKERYTWKPSLEQMTALAATISYFAKKDAPHYNDYLYNVLKSLKQDLNKLM